MASEAWSPKAREAVPGAGRARHRTQPDVNESPPPLARGVLLDAAVVRVLLVPTLVGFRTLELMAARAGDAAAGGPAAAGGLGGQDAPRALVRRFAGCDQSAFVGDRDEPGAVVAVELAQDVADVALGGEGADHESAGDFVV
jgi:hypothetical protein